jgi:hypothetical protein
MAHASRQQLPVASFATLHGVLGGRAQGRTTGDLRTAHHRTSHPHRAALARAAARPHRRLSHAPLANSMAAGCAHRGGGQRPTLAVGGLHGVAMRPPRGGRHPALPVGGGLRIGVEQNRNLRSADFYIEDQIHCKIKKRIRCGFKPQIDT